MDRYREVARELPGVVEDGPDPPDFIVRDGDRVTTVELTRYHQDSGKVGSARARQESLEWRVMARAQTTFEALHPGVWVHVEPFFREGVLTKRNVGGIAERLAGLVAEEVPLDPSTSPSWTETEVTWERLHAADLDFPLVYLSLWRHRWMREGEWMPTVSGMAAADLTHFGERLRIKESDLSDYRQEGAPAWLIIYSPSLHASSFVDFEALRPPLFQTTFDRVVLIDPAVGRFMTIAWAGG